MGWTDMISAYAREAERLRVIIETLAHTNPAMTMDEAAPTIFAIEKRTAELEAPKLATEVKYPVLKDTTPQTGALFIELLPDVQKHVKAGKLIDAIKEFRTTTGWGLKDSKDAVELWKSGKHLSAGGAHKPASSKVTSTGVTIYAAPCATTLEGDIASWFDRQPELQDMIDDGKKINAIKEVRAHCPSMPGLKEAKDGVEFWIAHYS